MRKHFVDNIRWISILLLFPYHTFMIYNSYGENFYVKGASIPLTTGFIVAVWPWFMPLLFTVAGVSSAYALQRRSAGQYGKERVLKLLIPLLSGIILLIPMQTYFAERFHNGYTGGYLQQYILFFTKHTDLTGYTGGFTPGQLWFILYLFIISMIALPIMAWYQRSKRKIQTEKLPVFVLPALFLLPLIGALILDIGGKSLGEYFAYFMLGYFLLSSDAIQQKLENHRLPLTILAAGCMLLTLLGWAGVFGQTPEILSGILSRLYGWSMILCIFGLGRRHLNFSNKATGYLSAASFPVYVFHQSLLIASAYYVFQLTDNAALQIVLILTASVVLTFAAYELCRRLPGVRFLFGIKPRGK